ncbi:A disintegrin and metalloproteinase with thrombospondin motifs 1-like [Oppia nitens]|uniref:A disintegrin and metalloproteinase with thrombospondin motifs 1-like n=1 Tax=Oppia nitens TaxID=1686743 RepID=UPI0023DA24E3|nr:A disintegrin and metalloproteinase with thrombospondin motifs 1-like [Oppia nitens]
MITTINQLIKQCIRYGRHNRQYRRCPTKMSTKSVPNSTTLAQLSILLVLYISTIISPVQSLAHPLKHQIHKHMSEDDLRYVFQVESHNDVPEYDVTNVRLINKRSVSDLSSTMTGNELSPKQIHLKAFGRKYKLNLQKNSDFNDRVKDMKVFMAETTGNGKLRYSQVPSTGYEKTRNIGTTYHDKSNMAAVLVDHNPDGSIQLHGTIGNDLVIRPVPQTVSLDNTEYLQYDGNDNEDDEMFLDEEEIIDSSNNQTSNSRPNNTTTRMSLPSLKKISGGKGTKSSYLNSTNIGNTHFVYKRNDTFDPKYSYHSDYLEMEPHFNHNTTDPLINSTTSHRRNKRQAPNTVWPEVLLVVDYDSYILHGGTSRDVKRYFISFWNGVDLRYKLLSHPQIRVSLAGMIVAKDRDATPYLERNRLRSPNADAVDAAGALTDMGKYLYREDRLPTYDLAVVITKLDMCRRRFEGGRCNRGTAGFAYVGGACVVNKRLEKVNSVAIIEDSGGFSGIIVAAHEVGHLLGCVHDGSPPPSYLGGPGATRCPWEDGFIMSDLRHTERGFRWSSCSVEQFKHFLNGETATCLYNFPHENQLLPRVLPGTMLSLDEQCKRDRGTNACFKDARVCAQLFCFDSASGYCVSYRPAAEGSPCGDGQTCRNGKCLAEMENIIPDYTHVTQTVSRVPAPNTDRILSRSDTSSGSRRQTRLRSRQGLTRSASPYLRMAVPTNESPQVAIPDNKDNDDVNNNTNDNNSTTNGPTIQQTVDCLNSVQRMAGSLTCTQFLERFGDKYCKHDYIKRNCCASHQLMCTKSSPDS